MNCPSRTDEPPKSDGRNQSPNALSNDLTTNQDLNGLANARRLRRTPSPPIQSAGLAEPSNRGGLGDSAGIDESVAMKTAAAGRVVAVDPAPAQGEACYSQQGSGRPPSNHGGGGRAVGDGNGGSDGSHSEASRPQLKSYVWKAWSSLKTFVRFVGPGFIISVAYIDPGNYATDIAAGASYRFQLLFVVLLSNIFAIFLQSMSIKLGTVSGRNLAEACRAFLPRWLNYGLYILAEVAIIATDIAEVIGTAIALNLLQPKIPLVAGCAISILDVLVVLVFCRPDSGSRRGVRAFELLVVPLVLGVVVCFCIQLSLVADSAGAGEVFRGYLPSSALVQQQGLYQACGILGATVMPHSLYLGSGIVQARLKEYDEKRGLLPSQLPRTIAEEDNDASDDDNDDRNQRQQQQGNSSAIMSYSDKSQTYTYIPSLRAVRHSMKYAIAELSLSLFTFALFVNSAILIVAGAALYQNPDALGADIFAIHDLMTRTLSPAAGTIFALALLLSGLSAGIVCTVAGQMVSEGALQWTMAPWLRRLLTRSISIMPSIIIAGAVGRDGLDAALNATQVVLSVVLPFVTAPLLWFTCLNKYMTVQPGAARYALRERYGSNNSNNNGNNNGGNRAQNQSMPADAGEDDADSSQAAVKMANAWPVALLGFLIWLIITAMNVANLVLLGVGAG